MSLDSGFCRNDLKRQLIVIQARAGIQNRVREEYFPDLLKRYDKIYRIRFFL